MLIILLFLFYTICHQIAIFLCGLFYKRSEMYKKAAVLTRRLLKMRFGFAYSITVELATSWLKQSAELT